MQEIVTQQLDNVHVIQVDLVWTVQLQQRLRQQQQPQQLPQQKEHFYK